MAGPRTLSPARRAIVDAFAKLSSDEQARLRALAAGARMDLWDYLDSKGWGSGSRQTFSAAPGASPRRPDPATPRGREALAAESLADRARFEAGVADACNVLGGQLRRERSAR